MSDPPLWRCPMLHTLPLCKHSIRCWGACVLVLCLVWGSVIAGQEANAACVADSHLEETNGGLVKKLPLNCTRAEREAQSIRAETILETLEKGQPVELVGVIVQGDLSLDRLPILKTVGRDGLATDGQALPKTEELRLVRGALLIRDSVVTGAMRHRSDRGMLEFERRVDFRGTTFQEGVDLSRSIFQGAVDLAGAVFQKEAYFIQGRFNHTMDCTRTTFGPHTRFHRSVFRGPVDCTNVLFDGMAELLEVTFEAPVVFERARFGSGTGFSGSRFRRQVSFGEAIFSRDAFFTFSIFDEGAVFSGAQFLGPADFSDASFGKPDDLAKARFDTPPLFTRTTRVAQQQQADGLDSLLDQYGVTVVCLLLAGALMAYVWKSK